MNQKENEIIDTYPVKLIDYQENLILNPRVNPLICGYLSFNTYHLMPENSTGLLWSETEAYLHLEHTPSTGINLHSWALKPILSMPTGAANLTKIDEFSSRYDVHPLISDDYPATIGTFVLNNNMMRYLSGLCGKAWQMNRTREI
jgi:hypothetical protein